jgi:phytoene dehydrogenase-like protein
MPHDTDILVIGAGHNGLVCAGYLAKAGLDVLILERSHRIGGACVTEELVPGCRFSTFAYNANGPGPTICRDLEIAADAFEVVVPDPKLLSPFPDGDSIVWWGDPARSAAGIARFGPGEADGFLAYQQFMQRAKEIAQDVFLGPPPTHSELYERYRRMPKAPVLEAMLTRSHWDVLCDFVSSDKVRCALARADDCGSPTAVGSLLAEAMELANDGAGIERKSGVVRGGMGEVTRALADAARRFGARIRTEAAVERIIVEHGRAVGVRLSQGETLRARLVVSNADPKRTFLRLLGEEDLDAAFRGQVARLKTSAGYMKYHAVLRGLPQFTCLQGCDFDPRLIAGVRIAPSLEYYEEAWHDAQSGIPARAPILSLQLPTIYTPEMAPPGKHLLGIWVRYAPAEPRDGGWNAWRDRTIESIVATVQRYAPGFRELIEWQRLYTTADIERETGIPDGSIRHLDMTLDQMLHRRPLPAWSAYQTPLAGLWLCGSGTHPCGSVTGAPGHNAAKAILESMRDFGEC